MFQRLRLRLRPDDGQGLIMVLFTTMLILGLVVAATTITASQSVPARKTVDRAAALAAAEGGIQDYLAKLAVQCTEPAACSLTALNANGGGSIGGSSSSFTWRVIGYDSEAGKVRIESEGTYKHGTAAPSTRTLVADIIAGAQLTDFLYYSTYETQSSRLIGELNPERKIVMPTATGWGLGITGDVTWDGAEAYADGTYPVASSCDQLWYDSGAPNSGRHALYSRDGTIDNWGETGSMVGSSGSLERAGTCEVTFSSVTQMTGAVYSKDALLLSNSTANGSGPVFNGKVWTEWADTDKPAPAESKQYRSVKEPIGGEPATNSKVPERAATNVALPSWEDPLDVTCEYVGATRVRVDGATLVVTSPMTPAGEGDCYKSAPVNPEEQGPEIDGSPSVLEARIPLSNGATIVVRDAEEDRPVVQAPVDVSIPTAERPTPLRTEDNSLFLKRLQLPESEEPLPTDPNRIEMKITSKDLNEDEAQWETEFEAALGKKYEDIVNHVRASLTDERASRESLDALITASLTEMINEAWPEDESAAPDDEAATHPEIRVEEAESGDSAPTVHVTMPDGTELAYSWRFDTVEPTDDPVDGHPTIRRSDESTDTESIVDEIRYINTVESATATFTRLPCGGAECELDEDGIPVEEARDLFTITADRTWHETGQKATTVTAFPVPGDRAAYSRTSGDIYVDGTLDGALSLVAENNIIVTGDLTQKNGALVQGDMPAQEHFESSDAMVLIARHDVEVFHPVACIAGTDDELRDTTAGFCPDDITGLFERMSASDLNHPSRQYVDIAQYRPTRIDAVIYALEGSLVLGNYDRGTSLGTLQLNGAVYQQHRGAMGVEWAITLADRERPRSGYALDYTYDSTLPQKSFPFVPSDGRVHVGAWTLIGTSEILNKEGIE